ncbi:Tah1 protein [Saccharomycopsis crataegensis]|uniref:Tah1 protein n=1 Tax=Saccharomycopsis crataegensis TaxID=43959 RepID=A0AAV5QG52_9ASCO|nr:Tah1 protein [Saccharomycopsis crataegensis]
MSEKLKEKGNEAFKKQEFKKAAKLYRDSIKLDPSNPVLYSNRSMCFAKLDDWTRVLEDCKKGISLATDANDEDAIKKTLVKLYYRKGLAVVNTGGDLRDAVQAWNEGLKLDGGNILIKKELAIYTKNEDSSLKKQKKKKKESANKQQVEDSGLKTIEIIEVEQLPKELQGLIDGKSNKEDNSSQSSGDDTVREDFQITEGNLQIVDGGILNDGQSSSKKIQKIEDNGKKIQIIDDDAKMVNSQTPLVMTQKDMKLPDTPTHYYLTTLMKNRANATAVYEYLINGITCEQYTSIFEIAGIDNEFFDFFLIAATYCLVNHKCDATRVGNLVMCLSNLRRFDLCKMFCDDKNLKKLSELLHAQGLDKQLL